MKTSLPIVLCAWSLVIGAAQADTREDVLNAISRCGGISNDRTWLDCVYGAAQPMRGQLGLTPAPASQQALVPPAVPVMTVQPVQQNNAPPPPASSSGGFFDHLWPF
jgi:hypothetical protein